MGAFATKGFLPENRAETPFLGDPSASNGLVPLDVLADLGEAS